MQQVSRRTFLACRKRADRGNSRHRRGLPRSSCTSPGKYSALGKVRVPVIESFLVPLGVARSRSRPSPRASRGSRRS